MSKELERWVHFNRIREKVNQGYELVLENGKQVEHRGMVLMKPKDKKVVDKIEVEPVIIKEPKVVVKQVEHKKKGK